MADKWQKSGDSFKVVKDLSAHGLRYAVIIGLLLVLPIWVAYKEQSLALNMIAVAYAILAVIVLGCMAIIQTVEYLRQKEQHKLVKALVAARLLAGSGNHGTEYDDWVEDLIYDTLDGYDVKAIDEEVDADFEAQRLSHE